MKPQFSTYSNLSNTIINNARKDYTEFCLLQVMKESKRQVIFINEEFQEDRLVNNLEFLGVKNLLCLPDFADGFYNFSSFKIEKGCRFILNASSLLEKEFDIVIVDYKLLLKKLPPVSFFHKKITVERGKTLLYSLFVEQLLEFGFTRCENVYEIGEIAVRGFIIDVGTFLGFFRIEFEGEKINSIFYFNTETQRKEKGESLLKADILPVKMVILQESELEGIMQRLNSLELEGASDFISRIGDFYSLSLHNYLPLFYENTSSILSFFRKDAVFVFSNFLKGRLLEIEKEAKRNFEEYRAVGRFILPPHILFSDFSLMQLNPHVQLSPLPNALS